MNQDNATRDAGSSAPACSANPIAGDIVCTIIFRNVGARPYPTDELVRRLFLSERGSDSVIHIQAKQL
jgi:hypothetical protein